MDALLNAYNVEIKNLQEFYETLYNEIEYEPGKTTSLGVVYWGKSDFLPELPQVCSTIINSGITDIITLYNELRTPVKIKKYLSNYPLSEKAIRTLTHDIRLWLPQRIDLHDIPIVKDNHIDIEKLNNRGITDQIIFLSNYNRITDRLTLSKEIAIEFEKLTKYIHVCDFFRMGSNLDAIRPLLYYRIGHNTFEKWAKAKPREIINCFECYLKENELADKYLVPFTKEVVNGIEWAKVHTRLFTVEY